VSSYLGCLVRSIDNDPTIEFTYGSRLDPNPGCPIPAGATLLLMAHGSDPSRSPVHMVLYASNPGAFVDLAADLAVITGLDADHFVLDQHINGASALSTD